uniref:metallophosphoesterase n=1 Tax=uncultured Victivallis sp. TaxID=354118 RepID=UPI00258F469B
MLLFGFILLSYIICRAILPLRLHWGWKAGLALAAALAAFKFHILHWFGGEMFFAPELPVPVLLGAAWYYAVFFLFFFLLAGADIVRGIVLAWMFCRGRKRTERFRVVGNRVNLALLAGAMMLAAIGIAAGTAVPEVREERIELERLPQELEGFTIAVLADLHADTLTRAGRIRAIVERANACSPDLTVIAGDFVDGRVAERGAELRPLAELRAGYGVFGVPGNREYYSG